MSPTFSLVDRQSLADLLVFAGRAARVEEGSIRLIASGRVLAVYAAVLYPVGLLDETPTVLGLRTFALAEHADFDVVVPVRSLIQRLEWLRGDDSADAEAVVEVSVPHEVHSVTWAAISPPRGGWHSLATLAPQTLEERAKTGIDEVASAVPGSLGESLVHRVRSEVWGKPMPETPEIPAGAAFAAYSLGFLGDDPVRVLEAAPWTRLTTTRGHVLVRRRGRGPTVR
ncbi:hypothetical protein [Ruicaihuangia caeni]|uniref:Uncharacterized protein n=1 Tax=Ruicaihuangia caeni TaxID=3042517 RepID=A0AAW6T1W1_9MICO|nr:hypothetical protein [Klugiella sp. YN-L-19]MDI2097777.1 hypothetical protein [Klugiella sp. YN-L-19]